MLALPKAHCAFKQGLQLLYCTKLCAAAARVGACFLCRSLQWLFVQQFDACWLHALTCVLQPPTRAPVSKHYMQALQEVGFLEARAQAQAAKRREAEPWPRAILMSWSLKMLNLTSQNSLIEPDNHYSTHSNMRDLTWQYMTHTMLLSECLKWLQGFKGPSTSLVISILGPSSLNLGRQWHRPATFQDSLAASGCGQQLLGRHA